MRVKLIKEMDFRRNDQTLYRDIEKEVTLRRNDVACLVSKTRVQILFIHRPVDVDYRGFKVDKTTVYRSIRLRLSHGTWDPLMLKDYAESVGLELQGLQGIKDVLRR